MASISWLLVPLPPLNPSGLAERPGTFRGIKRKRKPLGWRALAPCATSPHPATDRFEAKQLRMCLLSKRVVIGPWPRVSQVPIQQLIALRPSNYACACCQACCDTKTKVKSPVSTPKAPTVTFSWRRSQKETIKVHIRKEDGIHTQITATPTASPPANPPGVAVNNI